MSGLFPAWTKRLPGVVVALLGALTFADDGKHPIIAITDFSSVAPNPPREVDLDGLLPHPSAENSHHKTADLQTLKALLDTALDPRQPDMVRCKSLSEYIYLKFTFPCSLKTFVSDPLFNQSLLSDDWALGPAPMANGLTKITPRLRETIFNVCPLWMDSQHEAIYFSVPKSISCREFETEVRNAESSLLSIEMVENTYEEHHSVQTGDGHRIFGPAPIRPRILEVLRELKRSPWLFQHAQQ